MFSIRLADGLLLLEVESDDGLIGLFYGLLLLDACGGITVSRRSSRRRCASASSAWTSTARHRVALFRLDGDRGPRRGPVPAQNFSKNTQRSSDQDESFR